MALNLVAALTLNGVKFAFGTNPEAEKFSLSVSIPSWPVEQTSGKGSKKVVTAVVDASFSKRAFNDVQPFMDSRIPVDLLEDAVDKSLPGLRAFWRKNGISDTVSDLQSAIQVVKDEAGEVTGYTGINSVKETIIIITKMMEELTPKSGSVADPLLEAKRIFSKSSEYSKLDYDNHVAVFASWEKTQLDNIKRVMDKSKSLSAADFKEFCLSKFTDNGVDEDKYLRLKAEKKS